MKCETCCYYSRHLEFKDRGFCYCPEHESYLSSIKFHGVLKVYKNDSCKYHMLKNVKAKFVEEKRYHVVIIDEASYMESKDDQKM